MKCYTIISCLSRCTKLAKCAFTLLAPMVFMQRQKMKHLLLRARVVLRTSKIKISRLRLAHMSKNCTKNRAARAARSFLLSQPIKSFICFVVVVVAVVISRGSLRNDNGTATTTPQNSDIIG